MVSSHIAHDCIVGNNVILANNVPLGGHAHIESNVILEAIQLFNSLLELEDRNDWWNVGVVRDVIPTD